MPVFLVWGWAVTTETERYGSRWRAARIRRPVRRRWIAAEDEAEALDEVVEELWREHPVLTDRGEPMVDLGEIKVREMDERDRMMLCNQPMLFAVEADLPGVPKVEWVMRGGVL
jgi:hypothetical protein